MATPQRVRDAAREADEQITAIQNADGTPVEPPPGADDGQPPRDPDSQFGVTQQVTPIGGDGAPPSGTGPITAEAYAQLQQRLATLEGNFNRTNAELAAERGRSQTLERMLERRVEQPPAAPAPAAPRSSVTEQEIEEYGADLTDFMRRIVGDGVRPLLDKLQSLESALAGVRSTSEATAQVTRNTVEQQFAARMNQQVVDAQGAPDWEHINHMHESGDTRFVDWLQKVGEDSDEPRLGIIQRAFQRGDADRCARMINRFKQDVGMADGNARPAATPPPANPAAALVSPSASAASTSPGRNARPQRTYTVEDVNRHYDEKTKGKWKGREAKWQEIADDMDRAVSESRFADAPRRR